MSKFWKVFSIGLMCVGLVGCGGKENKELIIYDSVYDEMKDNQDVIDQGKVKSSVAVYYISEKPNYVKIIANKNGVLEYADYNGNDFKFSKEGMSGFVLQDNGETFMVLCKFENNDCDENLYNEILNKIINPAFKKIDIDITNYGY